MSVLQLVNGALLGVVLPSAVLLMFLFLSSRSPFQSAARVHWLLVLSIASVCVSLLFAFVIPKFISLPIPFELAVFTLFERRSILGQGLLAVYLLGVTWSLTYLLYGLRDIAAVTQNAAPVNHNKIVGALGWVINSNIQVRVSSEIASPMIWGWRAPTLLLPQGFERWSRSRCQRVFTHELAHIERNDWLIKLCVRIVCAILWYLPVIWLVAKKLDWHAELACDDTVINKFNCRAEYAQDLLDISSDSKHALFAMALNKGSLLYSRIHSVLDGCRSRDSRRGIWAAKADYASALTSIILCLPLATIHASARPQLMAYSESESALYPLIIPNDFLEDTTESKVGKGGRTDKVQPVNLLDAREIANTLTHAARRRRCCEEMVVVAKPQQVATSVVSLDEANENFDDYDSFPSVSFSGYLPVKIIVPEYPKAAILRGVEGKVIAQFDVDTAGNVENIRIAYTSNGALFNRSVIHAVKQFQYMPLAFNGEAIKTKNVTETFVFSLSRN